MNLHTNMDLTQTGHKITVKSLLKKEPKEKSVPKKAKLQQTGHKITGIPSL